MRDHRKLRAFELADDLAVNVYRNTVRFPREEMYGLTSQMRRAAVSVPSNIVEGCARSSEAEYLRFLEIAYSSVKELEYQIGLSHRLEFLEPHAHGDLTSQASETAKVLNGLIRTLQPPAWFLVDFEHVATFPDLIPLERLKSDSRLSDMLVCRRGTRLSITPVEPKHYERVLKLAGAKG